MPGGNSGTEPSGFRDLGQYSSDPSGEMPIGGTAYEFKSHPRYSNIKRKSDDKIIKGLGYRLRILQEIETALQAITKAKESDDPMIRATEAFYLEDCLKELWEMEIPLENEFKELVNLLYLNLKQITLEKITNKQLDAFAAILDQIVRRTIRQEDFQKALKILQENDIEPWSLLASED